MKAKHGAMYLRVVEVCQCGHADYEHGKPEQWQLMSKKKGQYQQWHCGKCDCEDFKAKVKRKKTSLYEYEESEYDVHRQDE